VAGSAATGEGGGGEGEGVRGGSVGMGRNRLNWA
jgi:hypothetical protein